MYFIVCAPAFDCTFNQKEFDSYPHSKAAAELELAFRAQQQLWRPPQATDAMLFPSGAALQVLACDSY